MHLMLAALLNPYEHRIVVHLLRLLPEQQQQQQSDDDLDSDFEDDWDVSTCIR